MKKNSKKDLVQVAQNLDKNQVIDQSMKVAIKGGIIIEDGIML